MIFLISVELCIRFEKREHISTRRSKFLGASTTSLLSTVSWQLCSKFSTLSCQLEIESEIESDNIAGVRGQKKESVYCVMASQSQYGQRREQKRWLVTNQNDQHAHRVQVDNDQRLQCYDHAQCWTRQFNNQFNVHNLLVNLINLTFNLMVNLMINLMINTCSVMIMPNAGPDNLIINLMFNLWSI